MSAVRIQQGEPKSAIPTLREALAIFDDLDARQWQGRTYQELGNAYAALDKRAEAMHAWSTAEKIYDTLGMPEANRIKHIKHT